MEVVLSVETWDLGFRGRLGDCAYIYMQHHTAADPAGGGCCWKGPFSHPKVKGRCSLWGVIPRETV